MRYIQQPANDASQRPGACAVQKKIRQRGVALVTALLVVSLATVAAVAMATRFQVDLRRTGNLLNGEQAYAYARAAESWAIVILRRDLIDTKLDALDESWATALPPIAVEGGFVNGRIEDLQGRFNINNLLDAAGKPNQVELDYYKRLLDALSLDTSLATAVLDWIDADINATFPDGAEDDEYLLAEVPYRAANRPLVDLSELHLIKGYTPEIVAVLTPHLTALPAITKINVNTASPTVLKALHQKLEDSNVEQLISQRESTPFAEAADMLAHNAMTGIPLTVDVGVNSNWFSVQTDVSVGRGQARLESLLFRDQKGLQVLSRSRSGKRILQEEE